MSWLITGLRSRAARILLGTALTVGTMCQSAAGASPASSSVAAETSTGASQPPETSRRSLPPASGALLLFGLLGVAAAVTAFSVHLACEWSDAPLESVSEHPSPKPEHTSHPPVLSPNI